MELRLTNCSRVAASRNTNTFIKGSRNRFAKRLREIDQRFAETFSTQILGPPALAMAPLVLRNRPTDEFKRMTILGPSLSRGCPFCERTNGQLTI